MNIRQCRAEVPLSARLRRSLNKCRRARPPTLDELPYKAFAGSPLSAKAKIRKKFFLKNWDVKIVSKAKKGF
jgi:hypothetical protein